MAPQELPGLNAILDVLRETGRGRPGPEWFTASEVAARSGGVAQSTMFHRLKKLERDGAMESTRRANVLYFRVKPSYPPPDLPG